jgi:hypothetical protein
MRMPEEQEDGLGATSRPHYAQSTYCCTYQPAVNLMIVIVNSALLIVCFRRINHMVVKNHLHSSSDVPVLSTDALCPFYGLLPIIRIAFF